MALRNWKQGWRLWSPRSYTEAVDTRNGDRVLLKLRHRGQGVCFDRFGPNVGQPNQRPPVHPLHRDLPELASGLSLGCWTRDGCYQLELDRPEARVKLLLADSRSLACGPSDDPNMRQGVLLGRVECLRQDDAVDLFFELVPVEEPLAAVVLAGPGKVQGRRLFVRPGVTTFVIGRLPGEVRRAKAEKRIRQMTGYVEHFGAAQLSGPHRMGHAVRWNLCYDHRRNDVFLAVNRAWVQMMAHNTGLPEHRRGPLIFGWDAALSAILVARSDAGMAKAIVLSLLARQQEDGRLPTMSLGPFDADRMAPPLLPLAVWYLCHDGDWEFAAEVLPGLELAHRWMMEHREPRGDGLLCWGDDAEKSGPLRIDGWAGAAYESGMDDAPIWQELGYDPKTRTMGTACVDLCSLAALSARVLAVLCDRVGRDPEPYLADYRRIYAAVNDRLWSGEDGIYRNLRLDGSRGARVSPTSFYPMAAGLATRVRARQMISQHLRDRITFWGHPVIPSVPRNAPEYDGDGDYWRGRIWPPMNYLVWAGMRQYHAAEAAHLAEHCRILFEEEWERHGHVHENYSAQSGLGEPQPGVYARSCPMYCWGGLLLLPDVEGKTGGALMRLPRISPD